MKAEQRVRSSSEEGRSVFDLSDTAYMGLMLESAISCKNMIAALFTTLRLSMSLTRPRKSVVCTREFGNGIGCNRVAPLLLLDESNVVGYELYVTTVLERI